jgi:archaellin
MIMSVAVVAVGGLLVYAGFSSNNDSVTVYSGDNSKSLELRGSVFARCSDDDAVKEIIFTVGIPEGASPVNFSPPPDNVVNVSYNDARQTVENVSWKVKEYIVGDGDSMLESGETFLITGFIGESLHTKLGIATPFAVKVQTPDSEVLTIRRTTPEILLPVMNLE